MVIPVCHQMAPNLCYNVHALHLSKKYGLSSLVDIKSKIPNKEFSIKRNPRKASILVFLYYCAPILAKVSNKRNTFRIFP